MEILLDKTTTNEGLVKIKLTPADYQPRFEKKVKSYAKQVSIKGFRPGKAPLGLVKKMYGKGIMAAEVQDLLTESLEDYVAENEIRLIGQPIANEKKAEDIDWTGQSDLEFEYEIGFATEFSCDLSADIEVIKYRVEDPDDKRVDEEIDYLRSFYEQIEFSEVSQEGDDFNCTVTQKSSGISINKKFLFWNEIPEQKREKFIGLKPGDSLELNIKEVINDATYLANLPDTNSDITFDTEDNTGEIFIFTIEGVRRTITAELNQELYDKEFGEGEVTNEEELRERLRKEIPNQYKNDIELLFNESIKDALIEHAQVSLPDGFLKKQMLKHSKLAHNDEERSDEDILDEVEDDFDESYNEAARKLKWDFIMGKIAQEHDIEVTPEELKEGVKGYLIRYINFPYIDEPIEKLIDSYAVKILQENKWSLLTNNIYPEVLSAKVVEFVKTKITTKEQEMPEEDMKAITS